jgi:CHAD domain-containing protein
MDARSLLLDSLNTRWDTYQAGLMNCRDGFSEAAVHDFRVATRRLLALLDLLRALNDGIKTKTMRRILKGQLDNLDELRDTQVLLANIAAIVESNPLLRPFEEHLQRREKKLMRAARKEIKSLKTAELASRMRKLNESIAELQPDGLNPFTVVDKTYARVIQRHEKINPDKPATIHRLRIAFKKFRYMVEVIHPMLEDFPAKRLKKMQAYQTSMGQIQDMEVALHQLAGFEKHAPKGYDPEPVRVYYREHHAFAISAYLKGRQKVHSFWRSAPDQPFPKEK